MYPPLFASPDDVDCMAKELLLVGERRIGVVTVKTGLRVRPSIADANGDMAESDTAADDSVFYSHRCFIDRVFWVSQKKNGFTDADPEPAESHARHPWTSPFRMRPGGR